MTGFDERLQQLLLKVRARAERDGIEWRKADEGVFAFRAGPYVVTFARDRDPLIAIYDEKGAEVEAIDAADLRGRKTESGTSFEDVKNRIWRLGRRGAGMSTSALDRVMDWLGDAIDEVEAEADDADAGDLSVAHGDIAEPDLSPQAPQAGAEGAVEIAPQAGVAAVAAVAAMEAEDAEQDQAEAPAEASEAPAEEAAASDAEQPEGDTVEKPGSENGAMARWTGARPPWAR